MEKRCPSCSEPITVDDTILDVGSTNSVVRCSNCGLLVPTGTAADDVDDHSAATVIQSSSHQAGDSIGHFTLERFLGQGSFGSVWLAEDTDLSRYVALKLPKSTEKDAKLLHEARTAAKLKHSNIVSVYEVGVQDGQVFIASEFIDGEDLREELRRGRPDISRSVELITSLARAAHHAHDLGIIHRDLKPANILLNEKGHPYIADFGIAKELSAEESISLFGQVIGTIAYMSPEQASGSTSATDRRSDVYALGVMLFEMLTDGRPFRGSAEGILHQKNYAEAPSPCTLVPSLPRDLETICVKCLQREPLRRYQSAEQLADELDRFSNNIPIHARPVSWVEKVSRWRRRQPLAAALLVTAFACLSIGLVSSTFFWSKARENANETAQTLYRSDMYLAGELWNKGDIIGLRRTLARYKDETSTRHRDFSWNYFHAATQPIVQIANHGIDIFDVAVSHDGKMFASAGRDRTIRVWSTESGESIRTHGPFQDNISSICFSPADDRLASAHADGSVRIWNPARHDRSAAEFRHLAPVTVVRFTSDGRFVVAGDAAGVVQSWRLKSGDLECEFEGPAKRVLDLRISPNGEQIAIARSPGQIRIHDIATQELLQELPVVPRLTAMAYPGQAGTLIAAASSGAAYVYSVETGEVVQQIRGASAGIGGYEFIAGLDLYARVDTSGRLSLFDSNHSVIRAIPTHTLTFGMMAVSGDGSSLAVGSGDGIVKVIDTASLERADVHWLDGAVRSLAFADSGQQLAMVCENGAMELWNFTDGKSRHVIAVPSTAHSKPLLSVTARPNSTQVVATGMMRELFCVDAVSGTLAGEHRLSTAAHAASAFSADGTWLAVGSRFGSVLLFDADELTAPVKVIEKNDVEVTDLCFSKDGATVIVAYNDMSIALIDCSTGAVTDQAIDLSSVPLTVALCNQERVLAVGTQAGDIILHCIDGSKPAVSIRAHAGRVNDIAVFPGDMRIVSGGRDSHLCVWDAVSGERITTLYGHHRQIFAVAVSKDGKTIASGGLQGDVRLWRSE